MEVFNLIRNTGIVPVVQMPGAVLAEPLAKVLMDEGIPVVEIMCRNGCAIESIQTIKRAYPQMCVGAGTVLTVEQSDQAIEAGADFIVAPGYNAEVVNRAKGADVAVIPGCVTPTEIEAGIRNNLHYFKYFPVKTMGGSKALRELEGPYPVAKFVVTGGLQMQDLEEYFAAGNVLAAGGDFIASYQELKEQNWEKIRANCRQAIALSLGFDLAHVGINCHSVRNGETVARRIDEIFQTGYKKGSKSDFAGHMVECMKEAFPGKAGHIAIGTYSVERAIYHFDRKGIKIRQDYQNAAEDGTMTAAYLEEEIEEFAVHVVRRQE